MNDLQDVQEIVQQYYVKGGNVLNSGADNKDTTAPVKANKLFKEGLSRLRKLKLSNYDRQNIGLLRKGFEHAIKSTDEFKRGKIEKAGRLSLQSSDYVTQYANIIAARYGSDE